ncbi:MAG: hypothetical protein IKU52_01840 [Clostridia bacterium]|nr:hypothetical protein [Clostridia bacterium]
MAENKSLFHGSNCSENVCIDCNRILDSCRDKDCFEDVRVYLSSYGQDIIEKTTNIRVKKTKVVWTQLGVERVQFNRGFYQITVRFYTKLIFEACLCPGKVEEFDGIAVTEKRIILYGSEGNVNIFKCEGGEQCFCECPTSDTATTNAPTVVCEVTDPIALGLKVAKDEIKCCCCCCAEDIPERVCESLNGMLCDDDFDRKKLYVSLGFFSVIRIERPAQYMITAREYTVPDKVCVETNDEDPCSVFAKMSFPINEFYPPSFRDSNGVNNCGCK